LRRDLDEWFHSKNLRPTVVGEFADLAQLRVFAEERFGVFAVPAVMEEQMRRHGFYKMGTTTSITVRFYAISVERQVQHPAVVAVCDAARNSLFRVSSRKCATAKRRKDSIGTLYCRAALV
jgi:LysR family transcriptional activator of nhaA